MSELITEWQSQVQALTFWRVVGLYALYEFLSWVVKSCFKLKRWAESGLASKPLYKAAECGVELTMPTSYQKLVLLRQLRDCYVREKSTMRDEIK